MFLLFIRFALFLLFSLANGQTLRPLSETGNRSQLGDEVPQSQNPLGFNSFNRAIDFNSQLNPSGFTNINPGFSSLGFQQFGNNPFLGFPTNDIFRNQGSLPQNQINRQIPRPLMIDENGLPSDSTLFPSVLGPPRFRNLAPTSHVLTSVLSLDSDQISPRQSFVPNSFNGFNLGRNPFGGNPTQFPSLNQFPQQNSFIPQIPGLNPQLQGLNPQFQGLNPQFQGINPQFQGLNPQFQSINPQFQGLNPQFQGLNSQFQGVNPLLQGLNPQFQGLNPQFQGLIPQFQGVNPLLQGLNPQLQSFGPQLQGFNPQLQGFNQFSQFGGNLDPFQQELSTDNSFLNLLSNNFMRRQIGEVSF